MSEESGHQELSKLFNILNAILDFDIPIYAEMFKNSDYDYMGSINKTRTAVTMAYERRQLPKLKKIYKDLVEPYKNNQEFPKYIKEKTGFSIMPLKELEERINKIVKQKKIATEDECRDVMEMISISILDGDKKKLLTLQKLIDDFEIN